MSDPQCIFCGKTEDQVRRLIAGPYGAICDECTRVTMSVVRAEQEAIISGGLLPSSSTDCYHRKLPDEPHFTLLARDPMFAAMVRQWADYRGQLIACGELPESDREQVLNARMIAADGIEWRYRHNGEWRK